MMRSDETMLSVRSLSASIGKIPVLRGVNLTVGEGETVSVLGRNGVGKTTTLRTILGLLAQTGGEVRYRNQDLRKLPAHKLATLGLGYVPQGRGIFPLLSVEENLFIGLKRRPSADARANVFAHFPRLEERRHQRAGTLSGGEQQMLALARCLAMQPSLIMLDEPTEGIMPRLVTQIRKEIAGIAQRGISVLLVEQNLNTALKLSDRIYLMERGQIVHEATPVELKAEPAIVHRFLGVSI
jgi:branched-chain amino acid transport system ATP-binding protein